MKWYHQQQATREQYEILSRVVGEGSPGDKFLWPLELAHADGVAGFGYVTALRDERHKTLFDLMSRRVEPTFRTLATAGINLATAS